MANRRRCNVCRNYFESDVLFKVMSVWVCSTECKDEKLRSQRTQARKREAVKASKVDKSAIRQTVAERDGAFCLACGVTVGLHLHRCRYGSEGGEYEPDNTVLLCEAHHNNAQTGVHSNKKLYQPLLLRHLAGDRSAVHALRRQLRADER